MKATRLAMATLVWGVLAGVSLQQVRAEERAGPPVGPTVTVEIVAVDAKGRLVTDLVPSDVDVRQNGVRQTVSALEAKAAKGHYDLSYAPSTGVAAAMTLHSVRKGVIVQAPGGGPLKPRVISAQSSLETELLQLGRSRPDARDLPVDVRVLRFDAGTKGIQHMVLAEVRGYEIAQIVSPAQPVVHILAQVRGAADGDVRRVCDELNSLEKYSRVVWTSQQYLRPGDYSVDVVLREATTGKATVRNLPLSVSRAGPGLRMSSVTLLQPFSAMVYSRGIMEDPLRYQGEAVQPTIDLTLAHGEVESARFFLVIYPDASDLVSPTLTLEVLRDGKPVGSTPVQIAKPERPGAPITCSGYVPTQSFRIATYTLHFVARQGEAAVSEDVSLRIEDATFKDPVLRF